MHDAHRNVCRAVRDWRNDRITVDNVTAVALREAGGDEEAARELLKAAVEWWQYINTFKTVNGENRRVA